MMRDMHLHSSFSDGKNTIDEMVRCSIILGLKGICFTDHVWKTSTWTDEYFEEIQKCRKIYGDVINIIGGVEAKVINMDGALDIADKMYQKRIRVVAAMHRIPLGNGCFISRNMIKNDIDECKKLWLNAFSGLTKNKRITCIAHPFSLLELMDINQFDDAWWEEISAIIDKAPFEIEYNVKYNNNIVPSWFWRKYWDRVIPASDSHSINDLVERYEKLKAIKIR